MSTESLPLAVPDSLARELDPAGEDLVVDLLERGLRVFKIEQALDRTARGGISFPSGALWVVSRTVQSTPESGGRAGYDGHKRRKGSKVHLAVDTLGGLLAVLVTPANEQERADPGGNRRVAGSGLCGPGPDR